MPFPSRDRRAPTRFMDEQSRGSAAVARAPRAGHAARIAAHLAEAERSGRLPVRHINFNPEAAGARPAERPRAAIPRRAPAAAAVPDLPAAAPAVPAGAAARAAPAAAAAAAPIVRGAVQEPARGAAVPAGAAAVLSSPIKAPRSGDAGRAAERFLNEVLSGEELKDAWAEPLRAIGFLDGKRLLNYPGLRGGAVGVGGLAFNEASDRLAAKMRSVPVTVPGNDTAGFRHQLSCILRVIAAQESRLTALMVTTGPDAPSPDVVEVDEPRTSREGNADRETRIVSELELCVENQMHGEAPPCSLQPCFADTLRFFEALSRDPGHVIPITACSLDSRSGSGVGGSLERKHKKDQVFKHRRGVSRSQEQTLLRSYMRAASTAGAFEAECHDLVESDYAAGCEDASGNVVALVANYQPTMTLVEAATVEMDRAHLDGDQSKRFVNDFIEAIDTSLNKRRTLTESTRVAVELQLSRAIVSGGKSKGRSTGRESRNRPSDSDDSATDSSDSDSSAAPRKRRKTKPTKQSKTRGGRGGDTVLAMLKKLTQSGSSGGRYVATNNQTLFDYMIPQSHPAPCPRSQHDHPAISQRRRRVDWRPPKRRRRRQLGQRSRRPVLRLRQQKVRQQRSGLLSCEL